MMGLAGTLFTVGADGQSRAKQRSHYEKSSARKSQWLDTRLFAGSERKLTARQRAVCVSRRAGRFGGRACLCDTTTMHITQGQDSGETDYLFTSFTSGGFPEVNKIIDRRQADYPPLFTSFTSFSEVCGIHAGGRARGRARFSLTPIRDTSERSERDGTTPTPCSDYFVHFEDFDEVNKQLSFTSWGGMA
jgi:hypothetical protein